ncbi:hypothetical protein BU24DRAFT_416789 [Aaosphaeria arxii CBS 175.79]|uniref:PH domain-containing protein n=1 Tax=Aaosphaeria arxii CBS 175.79 TaxID=1450172 RepID=A0A6A5Y7C7_9PLEO|nr:uncharacterized protein BU24DRAFT_416789 [Aaosphaeria arxii CBS 175.79]KAF2021123.1 hypothetical protein BU24DRAFT_416789 [Aaosphaeria arxii CBS 175.79]
MVLQEEAERQRRVQEKLKAERRAKQEAEEAERKRQEQLRREEEEDAERQRAQKEAEEAERVRRAREEQERGKRLQKAESAARLKRREEEQAREAARAKAAQALTANSSSSPPSSPPRQGGGFGMFHRRRKDDLPASSESSPSGGGRPRQTSDGKDRDLDTIRPGGGGAVLGIDAPISAVNAGDRRVMIVCNQQHIYLPVNVTTTSLDLIKSAATVLTEPIDVRTAVIQENFTKVGLMRPIRNYEHIRDIMNSWDDDKQNDLIILDSRASGINQEELLAANAPTSRPGPFGCYMHYSSKPGKWTKKWIGLRQDGQLVISKSEDAKAEENLCHLSDFDLYTPTERKFSKIKPPKKVCFAVKSQLKSNIYVDETRFVNFFCTNDRAVAADFHKNLHDWRSWYLRNVLGEGQKKKGPDTKTAGGFRSTSGNPEQSAPQGHARNASVGSHYQLGTFSPLLDLDLFSKDNQKDDFKFGAFPDDAPLSRLDTKTMHQRKMSTRTKGPPPVSYSLNKDDMPPMPNRQNSFSPSTNSQEDGEVFASGGLLGRTYTQRQKVMNDREQHKNATLSGPFTEGPSLLNNMQSSQPSNDTLLSRRSSVRSNHHRRTSSDIQRSMSTRVKPKPLVDLTPTYREPPQHARKGKAFIPDTTSAPGPLVENATSLEEAIKVPSAVDWRTGPRPTTARTRGHFGPEGHERTRSLKGRGEALANHAVNNHENVPEDSNNAFTGGGLLAARTGFSQGHTPVGHGVMDGSKAKGPMLDLREGSKFATGSLLAGVERSQGGNGGGGQ